MTCAHLQGSACDNVLPYPIGTPTHGTLLVEGAEVLDGVGVVEGPVARETVCWHAEEIGGRTHEKHTERVKIMWCAIEINFTT